MFLQQTKPTRSLEERPAEAQHHLDSTADVAQQSLPLPGGVPSVDAVVAAFGHWGPEPIKRRADRLAAEELLTSKQLPNHDGPARAMRILLQIPEAERARAIDNLSPKAFENLLDRIPEADREAFARLAGTTNPARRLRLWAESHKARAANDVGRHKADVGKDDHRTEKQKDTYRRHSRRRRAAKQTKREIDWELEPLLEAAEAGKLTLEQVDALRERKELEYQIELEHNLNLTNQQVPRHDGSRVVWSKRELDSVASTLSQLPKAHLSSRELEEIRRIAYTKTHANAHHFGNTIEVTDRGADKDKYLALSGVRRELTSDAFREKHGDKVRALDELLAHEIGHDVDDHFATPRQKLDALDDFRTHSEEDLLRIGLSKRAIDFLTHISVRKNERVYKQGKDGTFRSHDAAAIPSEDDSSLGSPENYHNDHWGYSRTNASEHFAEMYAKAVHVPELLYDDLITRPAAATARAHRELARWRKDSAGANRHLPLPQTPETGPMAAELARLEQQLRFRRRAQRKRAEQHRIMRNEVFGTDRAVAARVAEMRRRGVRPEAIAEFRRAAQKAMTPKQVEVLASELGR